MFTSLRQPGGHERSSRLALGRGLGVLLDRLRRPSPIATPVANAQSDGRIDPAIRPPVSPSGAPATPPARATFSLPTDPHRPPPARVVTGVTPVRVDPVAAGVLVSDTRVGEADAPRSAPGGIPAIDDAVAVEPRRGSSLLGRIQSGQGRGTGPAPATVPPEPAPRFLANDYQVSYVPVECIHPQDDRGGRAVAAADLTHLAESIRRNGLIQPLFIAPLTAAGPGAREYRVIFGNRRLRAARLAGLTRVPAIVRQVAPALGLQHALAEDVNRVPFSAYDRARLLAQLGRAEGLDAPDLADRLACRPDLVEWELQILSLDPQIQGAVAAGLLGEAQCRVLLEAPTPELRHRLATQTVRYGWTPDRMRAKLAAWQRSRISE